MTTRRFAANKRTWRVEDVLPSSDEDKGSDYEDEDGQSQNSDDSDYELESLGKKSKRSIRPGSRKTKDLINAEVSYSIPTGEGGTNSRWKLLMSYENVWPTMAPGKSLLQKTVINNLLRLDAMQYAKWFKELPKDCSGLGNIELNGFSNTIRDKAMYLKNRLYEDTSFRDSCFSDLVMWIEYCLQDHDGDFSVDSIEKVRSFIIFRVNCALDNKKRTKNSKQGLDEETAERAARQVQSRVGRLAEIQGYFKTKEITDHESIKNLVEDYRLKAVNARMQPRDYAGSSGVITKDINVDEDTALKKTYWFGGLYNRPLANMRSYLLYMVNSTTGRRGHEFRDMYMGMLLLHIVTSIKPVKGIVVMASIRHMKNCTKNLEYVITWIRAENPFDCPTGAIANYFAYIIDLAKHPIFSKLEEDLNKQIVWANQGKKGAAPKSDWWGLRFVYSNDTTDGKRPYYDAISEDTHIEGIRRALEANGIEEVKSAKTHLNRHAVLKGNTEAGVPVADSAKYQQWSTKHTSGAMDSYIGTATKSKAMISAHGWDGLEDYHCWRQTDEDDIPGDLLSKVFPGLDNLLTKAKKAHELSGLDLSAVEFCKTLTYLRRVFLEDAAYMIEEYPNFPAFQHPVFKSEAWNNWKNKAVELAEIRAETYERSKTCVKTARMLSILRKTVKRVEDAISLIHVAPPRSEPQASSSEPIATPVSTKQVPAIMERVTSLQILYKEWDNVLRPYFSNNGNPSWLETFGERHRAQKTRYLKLENTCLYIDYVATTTGKDPLKVVAALEKVAKTLREDHHKFVTQCMYGLIQLTGMDNKRDKTENELALENALRAEGLPVPDRPAKELRIALQWKNRGVKRKAELL